MKHRKYTIELLSPIMESSKSFSEVMRKLNMRESGGSRETLRKKAEEFGINTSHFLGSGHLKGKPSSKRIGWKNILILNSDLSIREDSVRLRRALIESGRDYICEICKTNPIWNGKELRLQVDHINRKKNDNRPKNLRFLCPNCHSQTDGFCGSMGFTDVDNCNRYYQYRYYNNK